MNISKLKAFSLSHSPSWFCKLAYMNEKHSAKKLTDFCYIFYVINIKWELDVTKEAKTSKEIVWG